MARKWTSPLTPLPSGASHLGLRDRKKIEPMAAVLYHCEILNYLLVDLVRFGFDDGHVSLHRYVKLMLKMMLKTITGQLLPEKMRF